MSWLPFLPAWDAYKNSMRTYDSSKNALIQSIIPDCLVKQSVVSSYSLISPKKAGKRTVAFEACIDFRYPGKPKRLSRERSMRTPAIDYGPPTSSRLFVSESVGAPKCVWAFGSFVKSAMDYLGIVSFLICYSMEWFNLSIWQYFAAAVIHLWSHKSSLLFFCWRRLSGEV